MISDNADDSTEGTDRFQNGSKDLKIRITRKLPAPLMDGLDVRPFQVNRVYDVSQRVAEYLMVAGYAAPARARPMSGRNSTPRK